MLNEIQAGLSIILFVTSVHSSEEGESHELIAIY